MLSIFRISFHLNSPFGNLFFRDGLDCVDTVYEIKLNKKAS